MPVRSSQPKSMLLTVIIYQTMTHLIRSSDEHNEFKMNGVTPAPHTYYQVLIDQRDCPYVVLRH